MKRTLGSQRLGSGGKMTVDLHGYNRSTHDLSYLWRSTMSAGTLVPFLVEIGLPGDTFDIKLDTDLKTHPTIGPLFGSYKVQLDVFECPIRLYNSWLHNNKLDIGRKMSDIKLPIMEFVAPIITAQPADSNLDNIQINPSCILAYLGIRGIGYNATGVERLRNFNATPLIAYWDIYKNYYANKQEEIGAVIHTVVPNVVTTVDSITILGTPIPFSTSPSAPIAFDQYFTVNYTGAVPLADQLMINTTIGIYSAEQLGKFIFHDTVNTFILYEFRRPQYGDIGALNWQYIEPWEMLNRPPIIETFPLENIDNMRESILAKAGNLQFNMELDSLGGSKPPYDFIYQRNTDDVFSRLSSQEGLALKTYQSDIFNNWIKTDWIEGTGSIREVTAIDTSSGQFSLDTLNLSKKVYDMLNRIAVSGGSYHDWIDTVYQDTKFGRVDTPVYQGGLIKELVFQEVISNATTQTLDGGQPLGTLAGRGVLGKKHKGGIIKVKCSEPCYIMGIVSITPRIDYSQGNAWHIHLETMDDFHKPALDEIGFQDLITEQMAWWDTAWQIVGWTTHSAGKQPAWINYMTSHNKTYGNFAIQDNEMFMTLNRRYERETGLPGIPSFIKDLTTYIDPSKFNNIFAQTSLDAQNFWAQIAVDITARRIMSARVIPNL